MNFSFLYDLKQNELIFLFELVVLLNYPRTCIKWPEARAFFGYKTFQDHFYENF